VIYSDFRLLKDGTNNWIICCLWSLIYRKWLWDIYHKKHYKVIKVKGWRTALVGLPYSKGLGNQKTISPVFWFEK